MTDTTLEFKSCCPYCKAATGLAQSHGLELTETEAGTNLEAPRQMLAPGNDENTVSQALFYNVYIRWSPGFTKSSV